MNPSTCTIQGCIKPIAVKSRGWCRAHYTRWNRYGDPLGGEPDRVPAGVDGWKSRYEISADGCWLWTGSLDKHGYGQYDVYDGEGSRKNWRAHRYVYEQLVRPLQDHEVLDHLCRNHQCVNPEHLDPVVQQVNVDRGLAAAGMPRKSVCKNGHEFTEANTYIRPGNGQRQCKQCAYDTGAERTRRYRDKVRNLLQ